MEIREKIIFEAGKLFVQHGTRQVTMDSIAQHLGISKRTIYENFKDKNDLLSNFLIQSVTRHKKRIFEVIKGSNNVIEALFAFGEFQATEMKKVNPNFINDIKKYHPQVFKNVFNNGEIRNYEITYTILKRGMNEGVFTKDIDIDIANRFIHHTMDFVGIAENELDCLHVDIWKSVHLPYLRGISTEKGNQLINTLLEKYRNNN